MGDREMACREVVELLGDHLDGRLAPRERARLERHIGGCAGCRVHLEQVRLTVRALGAAGGEQPGAAVPEDLLRALRKRRRAGAG